MNVDRKALKDKAKKTLEDKSILIIINVIYSIVLIPVLILASLLLNFPYIGLLLGLGIYVLYLLLYLQIIKVNIKATESDVNVELFNFKDFPKMIKLFGWKTLFSSPGYILFGIGAIIVFLTIFLIFIAIITFGMITYVINDGSLMHKISNILLTGELFIPGFIALFIGFALSIYFEVKYGMIYYMLFDEYYKNHKPYEIFKECKQIMYGHKTEFFCLKLSFLGWYLLISLSSYIPVVGWIISIVGFATLKSYIIITQAEYYKEITNSNNNNILNLNK